MTLIIPIEKKDLAVDSSSCVYALYNKGVAVYVGQTVNLLLRIKTHASSFDFDSFSFFDVDISMLNDCEASEIVRLNPTRNKSLPGSELFISNKRLIKNLNAVINEKLLDNSVFIGARRSQDLDNLAYVTGKFSQDLIEYIKNFNVEVVISGD